MKALSRIHRRLAVLFSRNRFDRDLEEEIRNHIEMQAEENQELGMPTGDAYAAGFLYAYTQGRDLPACARLGGRLAAEAISHYGARAEVDLRKMALL